MRVAYSSLCSTTTEIAVLLHEKCDKSLNPVHNHAKGIFTFRESLNRIKQQYKKDESSIVDV